MNVDNNSIHIIPNHQQIQGQDWQKCLPTSGVGKDMCADIKLEGVALFVTDPFRANSATRQNPDICNPPPYMAVPSKSFWIWDVTKGVKLN